MVLGAVCCVLYMFVFAFVCVCALTRTKMIGEDECTSNHFNNSHFFAVICFTKVFIYTGVAMEHRCIVYFVINNMNQSEICAHCIRFFVSRYGTCAQYRDVLLFVRSAHRERKKIYNSYPWHTHTHTTTTDAIHIAISIRFNGTNRFHIPIFFLSFLSLSPFCISLTYAFFNCNAIISNK